MSVPFVYSIIYLHKYELTYIYLFYTSGHNSIIYLLLYFFFSALAVGASSDWLLVLFWYVPFHCDSINSTILDNYKYVFI